MSNPTITPKELSYMEDCLGVEQQLQTKCNDYSSKIKEPQLKTLVEQLSQKHKSHYTNLYNQLNQQ